MKEIDDTAKRNSKRKYSGKAAADVKESAWQRKEGKNPSGGLNEKGRKSYERENLVQIQRPLPEGGPRKRSFSLVWVV